MDKELPDRLAIDELEDAELEVMIGLMLQLAEADDELSPEESEHLKQVSAQIGREKFLAQATVARQRFGDLEAVFHATAEVTRVTAQRAIFQAVRDLALGDGIVAEEALLLNRLAEVWQVDWSG